MQIKTFVVPALSPESATAEMNSFLRGHKVVTIDRQFVMEQANSFWSFCVTYLDVETHLLEQSFQQKKKVDYKEVLDENAFAVFSQLRQLRKQLADRDAVPAYAVFTDVELAEMAKLESIDISALGKIAGIGAKRVEKYGEDLCRMFCELKNGTPF